MSKTPALDRLRKEREYGIKVVVTVTATITGANGHKATIINSRGPFSPGSEEADAEMQATDVLAQTFDEAEVTVKQWKAQDRRAGGK